MAHEMHKMDAEERLGIYRRWVEDYLDATSEHRRDRETERDYRQGIQWSEEEALVLRARGQPVLTFNYIGQKVGLLVGAEVNGRTEPKCHGRNPGDDEAAADIATAALRYVLDDADWDAERTLAREQLMVEGTAAVELSVEADEARQSGNPHIRLKSVAWDRLCWDPHSRAADFSDAKYFGTIVWMHYADAVAAWPDKEEALEGAVGRSGDGWSGDTFEDKPEHWVSGSEQGKRVRVVHLWYRDGRDWYTTIFCHGAELEETRLSPYVDEHKQTVPGLIMRSAYVRRRENERYGVVHELMSAQDEVNKRRSKMLHLMNSRQVVMEEGAVDDTEEMRKQLHKPDGVVVKKRGREWQMIAHQVQVAENLQLLQEAKSAFQVLGPNESLAGSGVASASGRAVELRQQAALLQFGEVIEGARRWELRVYRALWYLVRQYWTQQDYVRVTDDVNAPQFLEVNKPITVADQLRRQGHSDEEIASMAASGALEAQGLSVDAVVAVDRALQRLDVDIMLDTQPATTTLRMEQLRALAELLGQMPLTPKAQEASAEIIVTLSSIDSRTKQKLLKAMAPDPEAAQAAQQQQEEAEQIQAQQLALQMQGMQAQIQKTMAEVAKLTAQVETERARAVELLADAEEATARTDRLDSGGNAPAEGQAADERPSVTIAIAPPQV